MAFPQYSLKNAPNKYHQNGGKIVSHINKAKTVQTYDETESLYNFYRITGETKYRDKLITNNLSLVVKVASALHQPVFDINDLVQEGVIGFMEGIERFDDSKNTKLTSYATFWIRKYIQDFVDNNKRPIHYNEYVLRAYKKYGVESDDDNVPFNEQPFFKEKQNFWYLSVIELSKPIAEFDFNCDTSPDEEYGEDDEHERRMCQIASICEHMDINLYRLICARFESNHIFSEQCSKMNINIRTGYGMVAKEIEKLKKMMAEK